MLVVDLIFVTSVNEVFKEISVEIKLSNYMENLHVNFEDSNMVDEVAQMVTKPILCLLTPYLDMKKIPVSETVNETFRVTGQIIAIWSIIAGLVGVIWSSH